MLVAASNAGKAIDWDVNMESDCWFAGWPSFSPFKYGTKEDAPITLSVA